MKKYVISRKAHKRDDTTSINVKTYEPRAKRDRRSDSSKPGSVVG